MASTNRRSFLARSAALAAIPAVATLAGGPAVNAQGFYVGQVEKNLYWVTDATYQAAFLTTREGVVLFDAPPSIGGNLQRAIDQVAVGGERVDLAWHGTNHTPVPRGPGRRRRLHGQHGLRDPRIDPPRPRRGLAGPRLIQREIL